MEYRRDGRSLDLTVRIAGAPGRSAGSSRQRSLVSMLSLVCRLLVGAGACAVAQRAPAFDTTFSYDAAGNLVSVSNLGSDVANCGRIGHRCAVDPNGTWACVNGACEISCNPGYRVDAKTWTCAQVVNDPSRCGPEAIACPQVPHGQGIAGGAAVLRAKQSLDAMEKSAPAVEADAQVVVSRSRFPESAAHTEDAQAAGQPATLTVDRAGAAARRAAALRGTSTTAGMDRDEYPPAMFKEGGAGASVRSIPSGDNRGAGACIGNQCRGVPDGKKVEVKVGN